MDLTTTRRPTATPTVGRRLSHVYHQQAWRLYHSWMLWKRLLSCYSGLPRGLSTHRDESSPYHRAAGTAAGAASFAADGYFASPRRLPSLPENYALVVSIHVEK